MSASKKYSPSDTLFYMSSQSWFLVDLVSFLEEIILCYLTLFSQVYFFRYLIKNFKVSICITLMYMVDLLLSIYCLQGENLVHVDTPMSYIYCSDAYSQDTCYMYISHKISSCYAHLQGEFKGAHTCYMFSSKLSYIPLLYLYLKL
jgi:hypothetical protein